MKLLVCRLILLAHPPGFRRRFGAGIEQSFRDRFAEVSRNGRTSLASLMVGYGDLIVNAAMLWWWAFRDRLLWTDALAAQGTRRRSDMWWQSMLMDARHALRMFRRAPGFTIMAVLALALGIGANAAIFSGVDAVLLRSLPYRDPDQLVMLWSSNPRAHHDRDSVSPLDFMDFQKASAFSSVEAAYSFLIASTLARPSGAEQIVVTAVTPGLFATLGRSPILGRTFTDADLATGVIVSADFWRRRLGGDPDVLGRTLQIASKPRTIVGVMPADFVFPYEAMLGSSGFTRAQEVEAWLPLAFTADNLRETGAAPLTRAVRMLTVVARLRPGVTIEQARATVGGVALQLAAAHPDTNRDVGASLVPVREQAVGGVRPTLLVLLGGVGLVLLMACVNLANMLMARSSARQKEMSVRAALGAWRGRLVVQALVEAVMLAIAGGALGTLVLGFSLRALVALAPAGIPRLDQVRPDASLVLFAAGLSLATGIFIGLVPALSASRADVNAGLKQTSRGATSGRLQRRVRSALVVVEAGLAVVLTIGAGLLLRSFISLVSVDPGFRPDHLLTLQIAVPSGYADASRRRVLYADMESRLTRLPGVTALGGTTRLPLGSTNVSTKIVVDGRSTTPSDWPEVEFRRAVYDYFGAMDIPVLRGRTFAATDGPDAPPVCVINETMASQLFAGTDPIGHRVKFGGLEGPWTTIVGVVGSIRHSALSAPPSPEVYVNYLQNPPVNPFLVLRTAVDPASLVPAVRAALSSVDKDLVASDIKTMDTVLSDSVAERRFTLLLAGMFGVLALVMAAVGVYGVMALVVSERAPEMAIRLALGADPSGVVALVVRQGVSLALGGAAVGVAASALLAPALSAQLFGIRPADPLTFVGVPLLVVAIAAVACLVPAWRTMSIDPVSALRAE